MTQRVKVCQICDDPFVRNGKRDRRVLCPTCSQATKDVEFIALVHPDFSGIVGLYRTMDQARDVLRTYGDTPGVQPPRVERVTGQQGALSLLRVDDPNSDMWDRREAAWDRADFQRDTQMYR